MKQDQKGSEQCSERISPLTRILARQEVWLEFDEVVFKAFVEKVVVSGMKKCIRLEYVMGMDRNMGLRRRVCALASC